MTYLTPGYRNMTNATFDLFTTLGNTCSSLGSYQGRSCLGGYQTGTSAGNTDKAVSDHIASTTVD